MNVIHVPSSELRPGDVVRTHGMRCRVVSVSRYPGHGHPATRGMLVTSCDTLVLNRDDVSSVNVPCSYTYDPHTGTHRWQVQGNDLVSWAVEESGERHRAAHGLPDPSARCAQEGR